MNKKPVIGPPGLYYWNYNDSDPYGKGAVMLHTLRNQIGNDTLFFSILKTFFKSNCYRNTDTKAFIALVNQMTGKDWNYFFNQYLYDRRSPLLLWNYNYDPESGKSVLGCKLDGVNPDFKMTIEVEQEGTRFYIQPSAELQYFQVPKENLPVQVNSNYSYLQDGYKKLKVKGK
jgi:aminopeptidase N